MQTAECFILILFTITGLIAELLPREGQCGIFASNRIIKSMITDIDEYPWTVRLQYERENETKFLCGGVLISKRYVLTQAYCVQNLPFDWKLNSVRLGEFNATSPLDCSDELGFVECADPHKDVSIEEEIVHENHTIKDVLASNDIALLRLSSDVQFSPYISPICLPTSSEHKSKIHDGKPLVVSGWGKTYEDNNPDVKLHFFLNSMTNEECTKKYQKKIHNINIDDGQICAEGKNNFCSGSGGNPLVQFRKLAHYLVGTESFGTACNTKANHRLPTVYTNILHYMDWIMSHLKE